MSICIQITIDKTIGATTSVSSEVQENIIAVEDELE